MLKKFETGRAPYFLSADSVQKRAIDYGIAVSLFVLIRFSQEPLKALLTFGGVFIGAAAAVSISAFMINRKKPRLDSSLPVYLILLALMIPSQIPWLGISAVGFAAVFLTRECYGGAGQEFFHPAVFGCVFLTLSFPQIMKEHPAWLFSFHSPLENLSAGLAGTAAVFSGLWLLLKKRIDWEIPALYLILTIGLSAVMRIHTTLSFMGVFITAFFFLTGAASPMTLPGRLLAAGTSALLTVIFDLLAIPGAPAFAVLTVNLFTPWVEQWILPQGIRSGKT